MAVTLQRPLRGARIQSFYPVKELPALSSLDSAFQLQEYISLLIRLDPHDVDRIVTIPGKKDKDASNEDPDKDGKNEVVVDEACWIYEQLRRLAQDLSHPLITVLQQECTRATCPEMKAGEWLYLCVAHGNDGAMEQCCAIDYIVHTLDSATALLNSPRAFPSRLSIPHTSHRHFPSLARRLGRIFAHAYFHHRDAFAQAEAESSLYARFLALAAAFDLVPHDFLVIPPAAAAFDDPPRGEPQQPSILIGSGGPPADGQPPSATQLAPPVELGAPLSEVCESSPQSQPSPRRIGRNRTDTMVFSEAQSVVEELARSQSGTDGTDTSPAAIDPVALSIVAAAEEEEEDARMGSADITDEANRQEDDVEPAPPSIEAGLHDPLAEETSSQSLASEQQASELSSQPAEPVASSATTSETIIKADDTEAEEQDIATAASVADADAPSASGDDEEPEGKISVSKDAMQEPTVKSGEASVDEKADTADTKDGVDKNVEDEKPDSGDKAPTGLDAAVAEVASTS